jgi:hypothetical protein
MWLYGQCGQRLHLNPNKAFFPFSKKMGLATIFQPDMPCFPTKPFYYFFNLTISTNEAKVSHMKKVFLKNHTSKNHKIAIWLYFPSI